MKTAELFVDITIVGFLALLWICGFLFSFVFDNSILMSVLKNASSVLVVIILIVIYSLGIIFDYINAAIFSLFKSKEEKELYKDFSVTRIVILNDKLYPVIENYYSRIRILRSIIISIPLITCSFSCFLYNNLISLRISLSEAIWILVISGAALFVISLISYNRRNTDYKKYISEVKRKYLNPEEGNNKTVHSTGFMPKLYRRTWPKNKA